MFKNKKAVLFEAVASKSTSNSSKGNTSAFVQGAMAKSAETRSGNGSLKYSTTGNDFVDQFGKLGSYKVPRSFAEVSKDCDILWGQNKILTVAFILYIRMITRVTDIFGKKTKESQRGAELKHEGIFRMIWLHTQAPKSFWKNITLFIAVGSWKDVFTMLQYDLVYNGWEGRQLDWTKFGNLIVSGLQDETQHNLLKKYLPQIKAKSACKTVEAQADNIVAKWVCSLLFGNKANGSTYKQYRILKTSGTAHEWQKLISQGKHNLIDFNTIHGRALNKLVRSKYLANQGLTEKYEKWITKDTTEAKYTGFVHELFESLPNVLSGLDKGKQTTINKQFETLVKKGGEVESKTSLIVVRDTSGSMSSTASGTKMSCYNVAKALALYFSSFLKGNFADAFIEFNSTAKMHQWKGSNALEKWYNDRTSFVGGTDFQSVIKLFVDLKKKGLDESEFPTGILCISDGEFNPAQLGKTNVEAARAALRNGGFSAEYAANFVIVLWNLQSNAYGSNTGKKFETHGDVQNVFYFSGYSAATAAFLMNQEIKTAADLFDEAMNQEVLVMVEL
jgi:hypothetical protein